MMANSIMRLPLLLTITALIIGCSETNLAGEDDAPQAADLIVINAKGYTIVADGLAHFDTLVITDGRVVATGTRELAERYIARRTIDLQGKTVLPGLIDAHGHVAGLGRVRRALDLSGISSLDTTLTRIAAYNRTLSEDSEWLTGSGWNQVLWTEKRFPTAADLDAVVNDRAVILLRVDEHAAWVNSKALQLAGITRDTVAPAGGRIVRGADGAPAGVLLDGAIALVEDIVPQATADERRESLRLAMLELASLGITSVHDAGIDIAQIAAYQQLADSRQMAIRISAMLSGMSALQDIEAPIVGYARDRFEVTSVKFYADGALGSRGAAMIEPYSDDPGNTGLLFADDQGLSGMIEAAHEKGFAANVHAIGDHANQAVLSAFAIANNGKPSPFNDRVEHAQVVTPKDIERFAELDIIASIQPTHATSDMNMAEDRVGSERIKGAYAWRRLHDTGVRLAAGSDFPVEHPNVFHGLHAAVTRTDKNGEPDGGWYPEQALTRTEALAAFTLWAAAAAGQADRLGSLEPGKWADFIVIDKDYFEVPESDIWTIKTLETWVGGAQVAATL